MISVGDGNMEILETWGQDVYAVIKNLSIMLSATTHREMETNRKVLIMPWIVKMNDFCSILTLGKSFLTQLFVESFCKVNFVSQLDMCLWNTDAPGGNKVIIWQKSLSPTFWPRPTPGAWDVSEVWATLRWTCSPSLVYCIITQTLNISLCL